MTEKLRNWIVEAEDESGYSFAACIKARDAGEAWMDFDKAHQNMKWAKINVYSSIKIELNIDGATIGRIVDNVEREHHE